MPLRSLGLVVAALLVLAAAPAALGAGRIYWANANDTISYANLDGSGGGHVLDLSGATPNRIRGIAIDSAAGRIYWGNSGNNTISYANLDGSGGGDELNISGATPNYVHGVAVDPAAGKIYWANDTGNSISFANLDGSGGGGELNLTGATPDQPYGVALDLAAGRIYWANVDVGNNTISYAKLDDSGGGGQLNLAGATPDKPHDVAIYPSAGKIYFGNLNNTISYAKLDGSGGGGELNLSGATPAGPVGLAIDPVVGRVYWANLATGNNTISYAKLDGSGGGGQLNLSGGSPNQPRFMALLRAPDGAGALQVTGGSSLGSVLSCSGASWAPDLLGAHLYRAPRGALVYHWSRDGVDIAGASGTTYTAFAGGDYRCRVTAANAAGSSSQTSAPHTVSSPPGTHTLAVSVFGSGSGAVTGPGINCPGDCVQTYADGTRVSLRASSASGSSFRGWGGACSGTGACRLTMSADRSVSARFTANPDTRVTEAKISSRHYEASFRFTAVGKATDFQCKLTRRHGRARFKRCHSQKSYKRLRPGLYAFKVRARGPGGTDPTPAKEWFRIRGR
jgi:DNA-binding beta-propeller fold protein YncE